MRLLPSSRGALPLAQVWLVHSGEASIMSMGATLPRRDEQEFSSSVALMTWAQGKLALYVSAASFELPIGQPVLNWPVRHAVFGRFFGDIYGATCAVTDLCLRSERPGPAGSAGGE